MTPLWSPPSDSMATATPRALSVRELIDEFFEVAYALLVEARFQLGNEC